MSRWKWYGLVDKLAMNNILNYEGVYKQNWIAALNYLSYHKEMDDYKIEQQKKQNKEI